MSKLLLLNNISAIAWREHFTFQSDSADVRYVLDQHTKLDFYSASSRKQQSTACRFTRTYYPDSEPPSLCAYSLTLPA